MAPPSPGIAPTHCRLSSIQVPNVKEHYLKCFPTNVVVLAVFVSYASPEDVSVTTVALKIPGRLCGSPLLYLRTCHCSLSLLLHSFISPCPQSCVTLLSRSFSLSAKTWQGGKAEQGTLPRANGNPGRSLTWVCGTIKARSK